MSEIEVQPPSRSPRRLPEALRRNLWQPGQSGNPGGYSDKHGETQRLARDFSPEGTRLMIEIVRNPKEASNTRGWIWDKLQDRAWGKPREYDPKLERVAGAVFDPSRLTPAELAQLKAALQLMAKASVPTQDVVSEGSAVVTNDAQVIENNE